MAPFEQFAGLCEELARTSKKLEKRAAIAAYLRLLPPDDAALAARYLCGTPFPEWDGRELNTGGAALSGVLKDLTGADDHAMRQAYLRHGDLGAAAFDLLSRKGQPAASLPLAEVGASFAEIATARGLAPKRQRLRALLERATPLEAKYLVKLMAGDMRIGVKQAQVEEAIAAAYDRSLAAVRRADMLLGDIGETLRLAAEDRLQEAHMRLFHPLGFMLASPVETVAEAMTRFAEEAAAEAQGTGGAATPLRAGEQAGATDGAPRDRTAQTSLPAPIAGDRLGAQIEDKYDGIRCQLHCGDASQPGRVALFSRSREDMTESFPELAEAFGQITSPLILDGEILAWSPAEDRALPFSSLQPRIGRKRVTAQVRAETPVVFMAFDLLYREGRLLLEETLQERRAALESIAAYEAERTRVGSSPTSAQQQAGLFLSEPEEQGGAFPRFRIAPVTRLQSADQLESAYAEARARGNEGVMIKALKSVYQPGRRGLAWLKLKRQLATLDVVVTAAEYGNGRRAGTLSDYTFAVRDGEELKNVGKAYSGLTDAEIEQLSRYFHEHTLENYGGWRRVEPTIVLEVAFNNVMRSERHASGFALRFPRIVRIRSDKPVEEIDTLARVEEIYHAQPDRPVEAALREENPSQATRGGGGR